MDAFLYKDLTLEEKLYLGSMTRHPGFTVFKKMVDDAFRQMMAKIVELRPDDPDYEKKLKAYQIEAYVTKEVCATLIKSIAMHTEAGALEEKVNKAREEYERANNLDPAIVGKFGNVTKKEYRKV